MCEMTKSRLLYEGTNPISYFITMFLFQTELELFLKTSRNILMSAQF